MAKAYKHLRRQRTERRLKNQSFMEPSKRPLTGKRKKSFIRSLFPELAGRQDRHDMRKPMIGPASYLLGAAAAWVNVYAAFVVYALTPLFYVTPPKWHGPAR
jgi:hypothetical protein